MQPANPPPLATPQRTVEEEVTAYTCNLSRSTAADRADARPHLLLLPGHLVFGGLEVFLEPTGLWCSARAGAGAGAAHGVSHCAPSSWLPGGAS